MDISDIIENSSEVGNDELNVLRRFIESLFQISTGTEMTWFATFKNYSSNFMIVVNLFDSGIEFIK